MFRENVLVREDVIARISRTMVPVAVDFQRVQDRGTEEAQFLVPLLAKHGVKQGVWIFSPEGENLGRFSGFGDMAGLMMRVIDEALETFGPVELRDVPAGEADSHRGRGFRSDGSVRLAEYVRRREPDRIRGPVISSVELSAEEFDSFIPATLEVGAEWTVPEMVAKKLCRLASPMCYQHAPQPHWVKRVALRARVSATEGRWVELRYEGELSSERVMPSGSVLSEQELRLDGRGVFDRETKRMHELRFLGSGTFRWPEEAPDKPVAFEALAEWEASPAAGDDADSH